MNINKIKEKVKNSMINNKVEVAEYCNVCQKETVFILNFKNDTAICKNCNTEFPIADETYQNIYSELKKIGVQ